MLNEKIATPNLRLRQAREQRNWTHKDVADLIGLPDSHTVGRWERGTHFPRARYRRELCRIFEASPEELGLLPVGTALIAVVPDPVEEPAETEPPTPVNWKPPFFLTSFIGRERETADLCQLLMRPDIRLVTLLGSGGVGKTRLSLRVIEELQGYFGDNFCFVSLAAVSDPVLVVPTIAKGLDIPEINGLSLLAQVKNFLRARRFLLVLDNFEQVMAISPVLEQILVDCPLLKMLVTSRAVLQIQGEQAFHVEPLALPNPETLLEPARLLRTASIALFVQRAQAARSDFQLTPENAHLVIGVCQRLDGLPLALELAAARVRHLPLHALLKRLAAGSQILRNEQRTAPERQRTLADMIKWSYDLLNEQEQRLFCWLAIFNDGCTFEAIEEICAPHFLLEKDLFERVVVLMNQSLLRQVAETTEEERFAMLETLREYGLERLRQSGELELCQRAHASYYLRLVEQAATYLKGHQQNEWLTYLDRELENLRTALAWLVERKETALALRFAEAFGKFCGLRGYWTEELRWLEVVLALPVEEYPSILACVLRRAGHLAYRLRNLTAARRWLKESIELSRKLDDKQNLAGALSGLSWTLYRQKETASVESLLQEGVAVARWSGDSWSLANALQSLGRFFNMQGEFDDARQLLEESVKLARRIGDQDTIVRCLTTLLRVELAQGYVARAAEQAEECFVAARELGTRPLLALGLDNLAEVALFQENYERAIDLLKRRIELANKLGDRPAMIAKQLCLGEIALLQGNIPQAELYAQEGLQFFQEQGDIPNIAFSLSILGEVKRLQHDIPQALDLYKSALQQEWEIGNKKFIAKYISGLAKVAITCQRPESAALLAGYAEAIIACVTMYPAQQAEYQRQMAGVRAQLGEDVFESLRAKGRRLLIEEALCLV